MESSSPCICAGGSHEKLTEVETKQAGSMENCIECGVWGNKKKEFYANSVKNGKDAFEIKITFPLTSALLLENVFLVWK